ncbi:hypothetical protein XENOCAPTIV_002065 [Xenoophorus captivus]|uniref:Biopterin-dependent aromatic amino acid hydroxylase family profile domain-containing protein n=1 Tax=Xenoophorus captivus TaxID=1517983 RepID=A0ABV0QPC6_9TELE
MSKRVPNEVEIFADCKCSKKEFNELLQHLKDHVNIISFNTPAHVWSAEAELDQCSHRVLMYGSELDADHPGFEQNLTCKVPHLNVFILIRLLGSGQPIPRIEYTSEEVKTWGVVFRELTKLYPTHACREYLKNLPLLTKHCGYREDNIPQLEDVSHFLKGILLVSKGDIRILLFCPIRKCTDITSCVFQNVLASRCDLWQVTFLPETSWLVWPTEDTCHELLGHVPLLADPKFAQFSQEIGLASLGATDEDVQKLATCYFFTIEFGLCKQDGQLRAYGAGLLSSIGELRDQLRSRHVSILSHREFAKSIKRPFSVYYNPYTQSVDLLKDTRSIENVVQDLRSDLTTVCDALGKMNTYLGI